MNYLPGDVKNTAGGVPGLCGDPFQGKPDSAASNYAGKPCEPTKVYKAGDIFTTEVHVIANHGGWWEMSICDSKDISQECFDRNILKTCVPSCCKYCSVHAVLSLINCLLYSGHAHNDCCCSGYAMHTQ